MKSFLSILATIVLAATYADAQMIASHAPTSAAVAKTPQQKQGDGSTALLQPTGRAVVKVNGAVLTDRDLMHELFVIFPYAQLHNGIPKNMEPQMRRGAMDMIIFDELVYQEALRRKMTIPESRYEEARSKFVSQFPDKNAFNLFLQQECKGSQQEFRRKLMRSLLVEALVKQEIKQKSQVSDVQLRKYYNENLRKFDHPESFSFQSISILPPENATAEIKAEAKKHAETALRAAKATKSYQEFGLAAEKYSEDDFRVNMGDHKSVPRSELPPEIVSAASSMKPGDVSNLISLGSNYTIFRLNAHIPAGRSSFDEVKPKLREDLQKLKTEQLRKSLFSKLKSSAKIQEL